MGASLTLDHVNYLIWRYLQEQGFGKSAVQMSREWKLTDPTALPFAGNVPPYALIQMLQDALAYDTLVLAAQKAQDTTHAADDFSADPTDSADSPARLRRALDKRYDFVNIKTRPTSFRPDESLPTDEDASRRLKKQRSDVRRKSSKPAGPPTDTRVNGDAMDVDQDGDGQFQPEDVFEDVIQEEPPPPPMIHTLEIGQSQGFQVEEEKEDEKFASTVATHIMPGAEILGLNWNSSENGNLLVTGGSAWHSLSLNAVSHSNDYTDTHPGGQPPNVKSDYTIEAQNYYTLSSSHHVSKFLVSQATNTASPTGRKVYAHAVEELHGDGTASGAVIISDDQGAIVTELEKPMGTVTALSFDQSGTHVAVVCIADDGDEEPGSDIRIWETQDRTLVGNIACDAMVRDACWTGTGALIVCGEKMLDVFAKTEGQAFDFQRSIETERDWEQVRLDADSNQLACISGEDGTLGILNLTTFELSTVTAQEGSISTVRWQPTLRKRTTPVPDTDNDHPMEDPQMETVAPKLLATSSNIDCNVKLWSTHAGLNCLATLSTKDSLPVWAFDFAPDGRCIAAACGDMVTVWKAEADGEVVARWKDGANADQQTQGLPSCETNGEVNGAVQSAVTNGEQHHGDEQGHINGDTEAFPNDDTRSEDGLPPYHCIAWDREGKMLAHGLGQKISIIELPAP